MIQIVLGGAKAEPFVPRKHDPLALSPAGNGQSSKSPLTESLNALAVRVDALGKFHKRLVDAGLGIRYEAAHARLVAACFATAVNRLKMVDEGKLPLLPAESQKRPTHLMSRRLFGCAMAWKRQSSPTRNPMIRKSNRFTAYGLAEMPRTDK